MEKTRKHHLRYLLTTILYCVTFLLGIVFAVAILPNAYYLDVDQATTTSQVPFNADITMIVSGVSRHEQTHNTYTGIGKAFERNLKAFHNVTQNATTGYIGYVSLSNDASPDAAWTELPNEETGNGADRKAFDTLVVINQTSINGTVTFTFSGTVQLQCVGIQWDSHSGYDKYLYAAFAFTQTTFNSGDILIIKYTNQESGT